MRYVLSHKRPFMTQTGRVEKRVTNHTKLYISTQIENCLKIQNKERFGILVMT
jgi:hypothetical protein